MTKEELNEIRKDIDEVIADLSHNQDIEYIRGVLSGIEIVMIRLEKGVA